MKHKPFKPIEEQIELLEKERGLLIDDYDKAKNALSNLNYYRLSGYSLAMKRNDAFIKGTKFSDIIQVYNFDKEIKLCILGYLEDIEIALRTHIAYELGKQDVDPDGSLSYLNPRNYISQEHFNYFSNHISSEIGNSKEEAFIKHHKRKYKNTLPVWVFVEVLSFGKLSEFFSFLSVDIKKQISATYYFNIRYTILENLFQGLVVLRNICAHHARLYGRGISVKPAFSSAELNYLSSQGYQREQIGSKLFFRLLVILRLSPDKKLINKIIYDIERLHRLYPYVNLKHYGFKSNWVDIMKTMDEAYKKVTSDE
jgi:abortive infection bacteriophage resistance protein